MPSPACHLISKCDVCRGQDQTSWWNPYTSDVMSETYSTEPPSNLSQLNPAPLVLILSSAMPVPCPCWLLEDSGTGALWEMSWSIFVSLAVYFPIYSLSFSSDVCSYNFSFPMSSYATMLLVRKPPHSVPLSFWHSYVMHSVFGPKPLANPLLLVIPDDL